MIGWKVCFVTLEDEGARQRGRPRKMERGCGQGCG